MPVSRLNFGRVTRQFSKDLEAFGDAYEQFVRRYVRSLLRTLPTIYKREIKKEIRRQRLVRTGRMRDGASAFSRLSPEGIIQLYPQLPKGRKGVRYGFIVNAGPRRGRRSKGQGFLVRAKVNTVNGIAFEKRLLKSAALARQQVLRRIGRA